VLTPIFDSSYSRRHFSRFIPAACNYSITDGRPVRRLLGDSAPLDARERFTARNRRPDGPSSRAPGELGSNILSGRRTTSTLFCPERRHETLVFRSHSILAQNLESATCRSRSPYDGDVITCPAGFFAAVSGRPRGRDNVHTVHRASRRAFVTSILLPCESFEPGKRRALRPHDARRGPARRVDPPSRGQALDFGAAVTRHV